MQTPVNSLKKITYLFPTAVKTYGTDVWVSRDSPAAMENFSYDGIIWLFGHRPIATNMNASEVPFHHLLHTILRGGCISNSEIFR